MAIVGFNFKKMSVERKSSGKGSINIKNNISVVGANEEDLSLGSSKEKGIRYDFEFVCQYEPDLGSIKLEGEVLAVENADKVKEIIGSWKKNKKLPQEIMAVVVNMALKKCNVKALILADDINLPPPIPLPKVNTNQKG